MNGYKFMAAKYYCKWILPAEPGDTDLFGLISSGLFGWGFSALSFFSTDSDGR